MRRRFADRRQRRALLARDHGCPRTRGLHAHHHQHWIDGGATAVDNLLLLCSRHHLLVHEGGWQLTLTATGWVATGRDGRRWLDAPAISGDADRLLDAVPRTSHDAVGGDWRGEPPELGYAVEVLEQRRLHRQRLREERRARVA